MGNLRKHTAQKYRRRKLRWAWGDGLEVESTHCCCRDQRLVPSAVWQFATSGNPSSRPSDAPDLWSRFLHALWCLCRHLGTDAASEK